MSERATWLHAEWESNLIYALVGLHIAAIAYCYFKKKENLVKPMRAGDKTNDSNAPACNDFPHMQVCRDRLYHSVSTL